jgi:hypothetical protein
MLYHRFAAGLDTKDLRDAKALLTALWWILFSTTDNVGLANFQLKPALTRVAYFRPAGKSELIRTII